MTAGSNVNHQNIRGDSPLHYAAISQDISILRLLLAVEANPNCLNVNNETPLHQAVSCNILPNVRCLLGTTDRTIKDKCGETILHLAMTSERYSTMRILSQYPDLLNIQDSAGNTALLLAVKKDLKDHFCHLIQVGADVTVANYKGETAITIKGTDSHYAKIIRDMRPEIYIHDFSRFREQLSKTHFYDQCEIELLEVPVDEIFHTEVTLQVPIKFIIIQNQIFYFYTEDKSFKEIDVEAAVVQLIKEQFLRNITKTILSDEKFIQLKMWLNFEAPSKEQRVMSSLLEASLKLIDAELKFWEANFHRVESQVHGAQFGELVEKMGLFAASVGAEHYSRELLRKAAQQGNTSAQRIIEQFPKLPQEMEQDAYVEFARTSSCP